MITFFLRRLAASTAFIGLAAIIFATLSPIEARPHLATQGLEHLAAFLVLGALLQLAFPRHLLRTLTLLILFAAGLEMAQHLTPDRHGTVVDFARKTVGALLGTMVGLAANRFSDRLRLKAGQAAS